MRNLLGRTLLLLLLPFVLLVGWNITARYQPYHYRGAHSGPDMDAFVNNGLYLSAAAAAFLVLGRYLTRVMATCLSWLFRQAHPGIHSKEHAVGAAMQAVLILVGVVHGLCVVAFLAFVLSSGIQGWHLGSMFPILVQGLTNYLFLRLQRSPVLASSLPPRP